MTTSHSQTLVALVLVLLALAGCARGTPLGRAGGDAGASPPGDAATPHTDASARRDAFVSRTQCPGATPACAGGLRDRAHAYALAHPLRDGVSWEGSSASLVFRFGGFSRSANTASQALAGSTIVGTDPARAPAGAFHWWSLDTSGHVGIDLTGGGANVFMASTHLAETWGTAIGIQGVAPFGAAAHARYLGWSTDYLGQHLEDACASAPPAPPVACSIPRSATQDGGVPDTAFWMRMQLYASGYGYAGALDGVMSVPAWAAIQRAMAGYGYGGPDDGVPGVQTYAALQRLAAMHGYAGPIDGDLGPNSYRGLATFLNAL